MALLRLLAHSQYRLSMSLPNSTDFGQRLNPSDSQWTTIYFTGGYALGILVLWHFPILKELLWPFKILAVGFLI